MSLKKLGKIFFSALLIVSLFTPSALPFSAQYAHAQSTGSGGSSVSGGAGASLGAGFSAGGLIGTAVGCLGLMDKLAGALSSLFSVTEVPVGDAGLRTKENCMDALVHQLVVLVMDKITLSTVDWINGGFRNSEGGKSPLWIQEPGEFFANVARDEIDRVTGWYGCTNGSIVCTTDYPFGQLVMGSIISTIQSQLAANVQFSLNQVLAHGTYEEYNLDFNVGGWAGYTAFFEPNNNPFGNSILINRELGRRIGGTSVTATQDFRTQLSESGGFLNQRKCAVTETGDPSDTYLTADDDFFIEPGGAVPMDLYVYLIGAQPGTDTFETLYEQLQPGFSGPLTAQATDILAQIQNYRLRSQCRTWKTTTPGNVISSKLNAALNIHDNKLIQADEVSESLGLIFDALINQLASKGLEELSSFVVGDANSTGGSDSVLLAQVNGEQPGQVANGQVPPPAIEAVTGTGMAGIADTALVIVQQNYTTAANQAMPLINTLVQKIHALDYCVPGPNPNWLDDAQANLQSALQSVAPFSSSGPNAENDNQDYYAAAINTLTGINIVESPAMHNHTQFMEFMNNLFAKYTAKMQDTADQGYNRFLAPPATRLFVQNLLEDAELYQTSYQNLSTYVSEIPSYLPVLIGIANSFNQIAQLNNGVLDPNSPEVQAQVSLFNSISDHLATQAQYQNLLTNIQVFQSQIATLNGHINSCLNETVNQAYTPANKRVQYPVPIFPSYGQNENPTIPTNMPIFDDSFLPGVDFDDTTNGGNIDVSFGGVGIQGTATLDTFEAVLQSIY